MKVIRDVPGQELELREGLGIGGLLLLFALLVPLALALFATVSAGQWLGPLQYFVAVLAGALIFILGRVLWRSRSIRVLEFDRRAGTVRMAQSAPLGRPAEDWTLPLEQLVWGSLIVSRDSNQVSLRLTMRMGEKRRVAVFAVDSLNTLEEGADFALRLASAAGFQHLRVLGSGPHTLKVELIHDSPEGAQPVPTPDRPAGYGRGVVATGAAALIATEKVPPFDPESWSGPLRIRYWAPGKGVQVDRPWAMGPILCLLLLFAPLIAPAGCLVSAVANQDLPVLWITLTLVSPGLAWIGRGMLETDRPRRVTFDWSDRKLTIRSLWRSSWMRFSWIQHIELRSRPGGKAATWYEVVARGEAEIGVVAQVTLDARDVEANQQLLAFTTELAQALGIEVKQRPIQTISGP